MEDSMDLEVVEIENILRKLAHGISKSRFTDRELELMARLRENRDVVLNELYKITKNHRGINPRGEEKIKNLINAIEKICGQSS